MSSAGFTVACALFAGCIFLAAVYLGAVWSDWTSAALLFAVSAALLALSPGRGSQTAARKSTPQPPGD